jgi:amino acid adenylation domain-containing protein
MYGDQQLSYLDLNTRANQLAHHLLELGVGAEAYVGVLIERSVEMPVALLSILKAGGTYVPLDPKHPPERLSLMINDAKVKVLITQKHLIDRVSDFEGTLICLDSIALHLSAKSTKNPNVQVDPPNLAYIIYTSGSTGRPKGVAIEQRSVITLLHWARDYFDPEDIAVVLFSTSICFDLSVFELFVPLCWGGTVLVAEDVLEVMSLPPVRAITLINTVPSVISAMLQFGNIPDSVRTVNLAGESLHRELVERIYQQSTVKRVLNLYGPTEDTTYSTFVLTERGGSGPVTIGRPISNTQVYVLDRNKQPVPIGIVGELYLGGAGLARGYLNRPDLTAEKFIPNPFSKEPGARLYRTGDLARYLPDGQIEFRGRSDFQVKVRGFRVELGEIEAALLSHSAVREAVVTAVGEFQNINRLVAYVVLNENHGAQVSDLRSFLHKRLPEYMIPSAFLVLDKLPLTSNRKVNRRALPVPDEIRPELIVTLQPARDDLEVKLTQIWEDVLQVHPIGVKDNFFDLGGHSMLALNLLAQLRGIFNHDLRLSMLMKAPTIESLAAALRQYRGGGAQKSSLVTINQGGSKRPIFFVHPIGGNVICYVELARHLGLDQPFYALQSKGLDGEQPPLKRIEDMAKRYIDEMRAVQPVGPYVLGGWSMGGIIVFEMGRQLKTRGQDVAMLALVDATIAVTNKQFEQADETAFLTMFMTDLMQSSGSIELNPKHLKRLGPDEQLATLLENAKKAEIIPPSIGVEQLRNLLLIFKENILATWQYVPEVYPGNIILFRAEEQPLELSKYKNLGWDDWASEGVEEHLIPGNHYSILREPNVKRLAEVLNKFIQKIQIIEEVSAGPSGP